MGWDLSRIRDTLFWLARAMGSASESLEDTTGAALILGQSADPRGPCATQPLLPSLSLSRPLLSPSPGASCPFLLLVHRQLSPLPGLGFHGLPLLLTHPLWIVF